MNKDPKLLDDEKDAHLVPPEATFNGGFTAIPKDISSLDESTVDSADLPDMRMDYGDMNEEDAKELGYTDEAGRAISTAKDPNPARH